MASRNDKLKALEYLDEIILIYETQAVSFEKHASDSKDFEERKNLNGFAAASRVQAERMALVRAVVSESLGRRKSAGRPARS